MVIVGNNSNTRRDGSPITASSWSGLLTSAQVRLLSGAGPGRSRPVVRPGLYVFEPFGGRERVRVLRTQPPPQVGQHIPELIGGPGMITARGHLAGDAEPEDQRDRVIRTQ